MSGSNEPREIILVACSKCEWKAAFQRADLLRENEGLPVVTIKFRRFALSTEIQTSSGPTPVDPLIAHDQPNP